MEQKYMLKSGEEIDLKYLRKHEEEHISVLEQCINCCTNHDRTDYFHVYGEAFKPIHLAGNKKQLEKQFSSPYYKVVIDLVSSYWDKCFIEK